MAEEYSFKAKKCQCGQNLTGVKVEVEGFWRGKTPMGKCPNCGRSFALDVPIPEPVEEVVATPAKKATKKA